MIARGFTTLLPQVERCLLLLRLEKSDFSAGTSVTQWRGWLSPAFLRFEA